MESGMKDRIRGSLMVGAAGDALGYVVEFMSMDEILARYGERGIREFDLSCGGKAFISDDTQMTLFTAEGILSGVDSTRRSGKEENLEDHIRGAYLDWYYTQTGKRNGRQAKDGFYTRLGGLKELEGVRAPGNTCLSACESLLKGQAVRNNSKGCGGIMRVAPVALFMAGCESRGEAYYTENQMDELAARAAAITHKHPLAFLPAAMFTHLIYRIIRMNISDVQSNIANLALETIDALDNIYR